MMRNRGRLLFVVLLLWAGLAWAAVGGGDIAFKIEGMENVLFTHDNHVSKYKQKCTDCHYSIFTTRAQHKQVTMAEMRKGKSCGACHNGQRAFSINKDCDKCHKDIRR